MRGRAGRALPSDHTDTSYGQRRVSERIGAARPAGISTPVYLEQVRMLYDGALTAVLANLANASILTHLLWDAVDHFALMEWLAAMVLLQLGRLGLTRVYRSTTRNPDRSTVIGRLPATVRWDRWYLAGVLASGAIWGLAGYWLFPHEAPGHQLVLIFILAGTAAGGTAVLSSVKAAFPLFALPALLPLAATFFLKGDAQHMAMGLLTIIYLAVLLNVVRLIHRTITSSITLRLGNKALVADLQTKTGDLTQINQLLRGEVDKRTEIQEQLQNQLFFLQELMDAIPSPVFHKDTQGVYQGCNKAFEKLVGRTRSDIIGRTAFEVFPKELADSLTKRDRELFERGTLQEIEMDLPLSDGTKRRLLAHRALYHNPVGRVIGVIGVLLDLTERKKA